VNDYDKHMWWMVVGAALASEEMRVNVFSQLNPSDCPDGDLAKILGAIEAKDSPKVKKSIKEMGLSVAKNSKCITEIVAKLARDAEQRKMKKMLTTLHATACMTPELFIEKLKTMITELEIG